jgi:hypothetical protein
VPTVRGNEAYLESLKINRFFTLVLHNDQNRKHPVLQQIDFLAESALFQFLLVVGFRADCDWTGSLMRVARRRARFEWLVRARSKGQT